MNTNAILNGRALAQTAVTLDSNSVSLPADATDTTPPNITILGMNPINVTQNTIYIDEEFTATDNSGGAILFNIVSNVNTSTIGAYTVTYEVRDMSDNVATATRTVNVVAGPIIPVLTSIELYLSSLGRGFILTSANVVLGNDLQLNSTGIDQFGLPMSSTISYSSSNLSVATVNETTGLVTSIALGQTNVTAYNESISKTITITVEAVAPVVVSSGSSGGGGGGGGSVSGCSTQWTCTAWNSCVDGAQTRTCSYQASQCKPEAIKPSEVQTCTTTFGTESTTATGTTTSETTSTTDGVTGAGITGAVIGATKKGLGTITWGLIIIGAIAGIFIVLLLIKPGK